MINFKSRLIVLFSAGAVLLASCNKPEPQPQPEPEPGKIIVNTTWPDEIPEIFNVIIGEEQAEFTQPQGTFPVQLEEGTYPCFIFNIPDGMTIDQGVASVSVNDGLAMSANPLWSWNGEVSVKNDEEAAIDATLMRRTRRIDFIIRSEDGSLQEIEGISARMNGMAGSYDIFSGELSNECEIAPAFAFSQKDNEWTASHAVFGSISDNHLLTIDIACGGETFGFEFDLSQAMEGFNDNMDKSLEITLDAVNASLGKIELSMASWENVEISGDNDYNPDLDGKQLTIDWQGKENDIQAVYIFDADSVLFTSPVENGKTTSLFEVPQEIIGMDVLSNGTYSTVTLNIKQFNLQERLIEMGDNYYIREASQLNGITEMDGNYELLADLDASGVELVPIGTETAPFTGTFDGGGHSISNLHYERTDGCALFAYNSGTIKNITVSSGEIGVASPMSAKSAAIALVNDGTIENCHNYAPVMGNQAAGIAGTNNGDIISCTNYGEIQANTYSAGIASINAGNINESSNHAGVMAYQSYAGGIAGQNMGNAQLKPCIEKSSNYGKISSANYTGGITGYNYFSNISHCANEGAVAGTGTNNAGLAGYCMQGTIEYSINRGTASVTNTGNYTGGIAGQAATGAQIIACVNAASVTGASYTGGIAGGLNGGSITGCRNDGTVSVANEVNPYIGGIVGSLTANVIACRNTGEVNGGSNTAGIAGILNSGFNVSVSACYSTGILTAWNTDRLGGIAGYVMGGSVKDSYFNNTERGIGNTSNPSLQMDTYEFFYDPSDPDGTVWPSDDASKGWGIASEENQGTDGYYWSTLGDPAAGEYPLLWWENSEDTDPSEL